MESGDYFFYYSEKFSWLLGRVTHHLKPIIVFNAIIWDINSKSMQSVARRGAMDPVSEMATISQRIYNLQHKQQVIRRIFS